MTVREPKPVDHLAQAKAALAEGGSNEYAIAHALVAIAERLASAAAPARPGPNLDLLMCNCGHAASQHGATVCSDGTIFFDALNIACELCDCLCFYTDVKLIDGETYPRRQP